MRQRPYSIVCARWAATPGGRARTRPPARPPARPPPTRRAHVRARPARLGRSETARARAAQLAPTQIRFRFVSFASIGTDLPFVNLCNFMHFTRGPTPPKHSTDTSRLLLAAARPGPRRPEMIPIEINLFRRHQQQQDARRPVGPRARDEWARARPARRQSIQFARDSERKRAPARPTFCAGQRLGPAPLPWRPRAPLRVASLWLRATPGRLMYST